MYLEDINDCRANSMRNIALEKQETKDFPYELYDMVIKDIKKEAEKGNFSTKYTFTIDQINKDLRGFRNLQKDWNILREKLFSLGYTFTSTIELYDQLAYFDLNEFYIEIRW